MPRLTLITGVGARGQVGEAVAHAFAKRGDTLLLVDRAADHVRARADEITSAGFQASAYPCDLTDERALHALVQQVAGDHGDAVDYLVNLAGGFSMSGPLAESDPSVLSRMLLINLTTAYLTTRAFLPAVARAKGSIVFFASENVFEGVRTKGSAAYSASKAAVVALMRSVADEGRELGIRANAVAPASVRTAANIADMGADANYVEREDVASVVTYLCSEASLAVTGQVIRLRR